MESERQFQHSRSMHTFLLLTVQKSSSMTEGVAVVPNPRASAHLLREAFFCRAREAMPSSPIMLSLSLFREAAFRDQDNAFGN